MIEENQSFFNQLNMLSDGVLVFVSMLLGRFIYLYISNDINSINLSNYIWLGFVAVVLCTIIYIFYGLYESYRITNFRKEAVQIIWTNILSTFILLVLLYIFCLDNFPLMVLVVFFCSSSLLLLLKRGIMRVILRYIRKNGLNHKHIILVGHGSAAQTYLDKIWSNPEYGFIVDGYVSNQACLTSLPWLGSYNELETILNDYKPDEIVIAIPDGDKSFISNIVNICEKTGIRFFLIDCYSEFIASNSCTIMLDGLAMINPRYIPLDNIGNMMIKRICDFIGAVLLTILFLPLMLTLSVGVKLSSPGPVIFKQERIGKNSKPFYIYKFRSMYVDDRVSIKSDMQGNNHKTKFGSWIRKYSIDELPQLLNVIKGEMSLVGPRPEIPYFVKFFKDEIPCYMLKHQVLPGMTGWAQVNGLRGDTPIAKRIEYDLFYIENWSILMDLKVLWLTIFNLTEK